MRKYVAEFIGTFFLVFTIVSTVLANAPLAPLAIGVTLTAMVFAGGHVSGAHFNPAVTLAVWIRGKVDARDVPGYVAAQLAGAVAAGAAGHAISGVDAAAAFEVSGSRLAAALAAEALVTFALAYVVLNVATSRDHDGNSFYGIAIGFTVLAGAVAVGGVSGGVFNPAVAFGVSTAGLVSWEMLWVYLVANLGGAALAGLTFRAMHPAEYAEPERTAAAPVPVPAARTGESAQVPAPRAGEAEDRAATRERI
jgi:aquaporin Z